MASNVVDGGLSTSFDKVDLTDKNKQRWKDFVKPLNQFEKDSKCENCCKALLKYDCSFLEKIISKFQSQEKEHNQRKMNNLIQKKKEIKELLNKTYNNNELLNIDDVGFEDLRKAFGEYNAIDSQKPDIKKSGSSWTLNMSARYFELNADFCIQIPDVPYSPSGNEGEFHREIAEIESLILCPPARLTDDGEQTGLETLHQHSLSEASIRMILDSILRRVCRKAKAQFGVKIVLLTEHKMDCECLPTNIFDYVLIVPDKNNRQCVGIVEAKRPSSMDEKAVAQLFLQMISLLTTREDPSLTCFGILSDGFRFLFAYANNNGVFFENKSGQIDGKRTVVVHKAKTWKDLDSIVAKIADLCCRA